MGEKQDRYLGADGMEPRLGEEIGRGHFSEVYAFGPGRVVKLFKVGIPPLIAGYEANLTQAVFAAGGPATEVLGMQTVKGRRGIVLPRLRGPTLLQHLQAQAVSQEQAAAILARLALTVHKTAPPSRAPGLADSMAASLKASDSVLPAPLGERVLTRIHDLPVDERLSHGHLHPSNVIMTPEGPRLIDWTSARRGGAAYNLANSHFLHTGIVPPALGDAARQGAFSLALQAAYARLAGVNAVRLADGIKAHLPVVRAFFLLQARPQEETRKRLLARLSRDFPDAWK